MKTTDTTNTPHAAGKAAIKSLSIRCQPMEHTKDWQLINDSCRQLAAVRAQGTTQETEALSAFIVRACNSHAALVAALERAARELSDCEDHLTRLRPKVQPDPYVTGCREAVNQARAALQSALQ